MKHWVLYIICLFLCNSLFGQVTVTTQLSPPPYKSGQPIKMRVEIKHQKDVEIKEFITEQILDVFKIQNEPSDFKTVQNGSQVVLQKDIVIIPKKYGDLMLSAVMAGYTLNGKEKIAFSKYKKVVVQDSGGGEPEKTSVTPIDQSVAMMNEMIAGMNNKGPEEIGGGLAGNASSSPPIGSDPIANPYGEIKDIKPIVEEPLRFSDFLPYLIAIFILVALISAIFHFLNKRKQPEAAPETEVWVPAHQTALAGLTELKNKQLWQNGEVKAYQTELTRIIRQYLENRFEINALEMTSDDIVYHLKKKTSVSDPQQGKVKDILQIADLVKFAKANPPVNINEQFWSDAENFVQETKTDEIPLSFLERQPGYQAEQGAMQKGAAVAGIVGATTTGVGLTNTLSTDMLASRIKRFVAMIIDSICFSLLYTLISTSMFFLIGVENFSATAAILFYVILLSMVFVVYWLIFGYFNANHRQTLGKKALGIVVTDKEGGPLPLSKASMRSLIYFAESIIFLPILWIFFDKEKQTLHDKAVNSIVIKKEFKKEAAATNV